MWTARKASPYTVFLSQWSLFASLYALLKWEPIGALRKAEVMQSVPMAVAHSELRQSETSVPERVSGWIVRLFGCWHREMSRPFSNHGQAYRVCLTCGAQRKFDLSNWQMQGEFYYNRPGSQRHSQLRSRFKVVARAN